MTWKPIEAPDGSRPVGAYSRAIRAGNHVYVSGHIPTDPATGTVIGSTYAEQTVAVLDRLEQTLADAGATLRDVVAVNAYLADMAGWDEFNQAYKQRMTEPYPTRTTVGAQLHGVLVEISVIAYLGD